MPVEALRGIPWTVVTYGATRILTVATTLALARLLVPADFGLFAMATLAMELLSVFSGLWLGAALIVRPDMDRGAQGTVLTLLLAAGAVIAVVLGLLSPLAAAFFGEPRLAGIMALLAAVLATSGVTWFYDTVLQRELAFRRRFVCQVLRTLAFSAVAIALAIAGAGVWSLILAYMAGHLANGAALLVLAPYRVRPAFDRAEARRVVRDGRGFLAQDFSTFLSENGDYIAVGRILGPAQLGFYVMAFRQAALPYYAIAEPVGKVTFPAFAQMCDRGEDVRPVFLRALRLMALVTAPAGIVLSAAAVPFTAALFGSRWAPMAAPLAVLGMWALLRPLQATVGNLLNSLARAEVYGRVSMLSLAPLIAATAAAAALGGIEAVAWVLVAHVAAIFGFLAVAAERHAGVPVADQGRALAPVAGAAAASWLVTRFVAATAGSAPAGVALAASVAACLLSYLVALRVISPGLVAGAYRDGLRALGLSDHRGAAPPSREWRRVAVTAAVVAGAAALGMMAAAEPKLAVGLVAGGLLIALPFVAPVAHLVLLVLVTAIVPFDLQNAFAFGGGVDQPGVLVSDVLLLGGLARAGLALLDTPLDRRGRLGLALLTALLVVAGVQLLRGLGAGNDPGVTGAELRVLLGLGAAAIAMPLLADPRTRIRLLKGLVGVGLAVGIWGIVQWTVDIPFTGSEDAGVRQGVRFTTEGQGQIQGGLFAFPVVVVMGVAALLSIELRSAGARILLLAMVGLGAVDLILTYERTFWIVTVFALGLLAVRAAPGRRLQSAAVGCAVLALVIAAMAALAPRDLTAARERLVSVGSYASDLSVRYRVTESRHVLEAIRAEPLLGSGLGATILWGRAYEQVRPTSESFVHNGYLWLLWKLGAVGTALTVLLLVAALTARGPPRGTVVAAAQGGAQAALVALLIGSITFPAFEALGVTAVMGVLLALCFCGAPREATA